MGFYRYAQISSDFKKLKIVGILFGGSMLYNNDLHKEDTSKDWDGIILVKQKSDITDLVNKHRRELCDLLYIKYEEYPDLVIPSADSPIYQSFDAVRFVGRTENHVKKGAKIISVEHFDNILKHNTPCFINLLSFKEVRYTESPNPKGIVRNQIQQATRLNENLLILHDMDFYLTDPCEKHGSCNAMFGAIADLFMTGTWVYDDGSLTGDRIAKGLFKKFHTLHTASNANVTDVFKNASKFHPHFLRALEIKYKKYYNELQIKPETINCEEDLRKDQLWYWGRSPEIFFKTTDPKLNEFQSIQDVDSRFFNLLKQNCTEFSMNSQSGYCQTNRKIFWKTTKFLSKELKGCKIVSEYYRFIQVPTMVDLKQQVIFYPFYNGVVLSNLLLDCLKQEFDNQELSKDMKSTILNLELQRSEDYLRAYCLSARFLEKPPASEIHRFFYDRLLNDTRFNEFYKDGIQIQETHLSLNQIKTKNLIINGKFYGNLSEIMKRATNILNPLDFWNQLVICGLGDSHCGNVMVSKDNQQTSKYLYIDYEISGFHSPILDLAKPFFIDIFLNLFGADLITPKNELFHRNIVQVEVEECLIKINLQVPKSLICNAIYEIKKRYLLLPFLRFIKNHKELELNEDWVNIFGQTLFCCALLSRNFTKRPDVFFANLALGVIFASIKTFKELDDVIQNMLS